MAARPAVIAAFLRTAPGFADARPDDALLADFFAVRDESAFAEIVRRHQRTVWGVCRRVLANTADAEDAFQATFVVLARRGRTLAERGSVGGWLYRVAQRVSLKARAVAAKRRRTEAKATRTEVAPEVHSPDADLIAVIGEELDRLPEKDRLAVIVCDLDGLSRAAAAVRLGWNEGTLSARLHRARKRLAEALRQRGVTAPTAVLAALLAAGPAPAAVAGATAGLAAAVAVSGLTVRAVSASVAALVHSTLKEMTMRIATKVLATVALMAGLLGTGWGVLPGALPTAAAAPVPEKPAADKVPDLPPAAYQLLHNRKVLKDLKCTPEQRVNVEDYFDEQNEKQAAGGLREIAFNINIAAGANPAQIQEQIEAQMKAQQEAAGKLAKTAGEKYLTIKQLVRLGQIAVQQRGVEAFADEKLVANLKLTAEQKKLVAEAVEDTKAPTGPGGVAMAGGGPGGMVQNIRFDAVGLKDGTKVKAAVAKVEAGLTKEQLAEWKKVTGEKVGFELHPHYGVRLGGFMAAPAFQAVPFAFPLPVAPPQAVPPPVVEEKKKDKE